MFTVFYTNTAGAETSAGPYCSWTEAQIAASELQAQGGTSFHIERDFTSRSEPVDFEGY